MLERRVRCGLRAPPQSLQLRNAFSAFRRIARVIKRFGARLPSPDPFSGARGALHGRFEGDFLQAAFCRSGTDLPRRTPHPVRTFRELLRLSARVLQVPRTYINCIGDRPLGQPRTIQADGIEDYHKASTGHEAMVTAPQDVVALLRKSAETPGPQSRSEWAAA